jgi:beta-glucanase (GH16 family)
MRYLFVLFLLLTTLNVRGQYAHPMELHDSIFLKIFLQDSIDEVNKNDTTFNNILATSGNACLISNEETYNSDVNLLDLKMPYALIFEDNFDVINYGFWNIINDCNSECWNNPSKEGIAAEDCSDTRLKLPYWDDENVNIAKDIYGNGILELNAKYDPKQRYNNTISENGYYEHTSGFIHSKKAFPYDVGVFQARIKLPKIIDKNGLQPAFWLMSQGVDPWNEFDIFEFQDNDNKLTSTIHVNPNELGNTKKHCEKSYTNFLGLFNDWVTYSCYWNKFAIVVFLDWDYKVLGVTHHKSKCIYTNSHFLKRNTRLQYKETDIPAGRTVDRKLYYPTKPMRLMFSLYTYFCHKYRTGTSGYPAKMEIDWVKVWYKQPCHKDLVINSSSQLPQDPNIYNYLAGKNVTINCNYQMPDNVSLKIAHSGVLSSNSLIEVGLNGYLDINPEPSHCQFEPLGQVESIEREVVSNKTNSNIISLYPNPSSNEIVINSAEIETLNDIDLIIFNHTGKEMLNFHNSNISTEPIRVSLSLKTGCYIAQIKKEGVVLLTEKLCVTD